MLKLLHYKPPLTASKVMLAFLVAIIADAVQIPLKSLLNFALPFFPRLKFVNMAVDLIAMIFAIGLLGFNWMLLPCFILEMTPFSISMPSWTAAVAWVVACRKLEAGKSVPVAASTPDDPRQESIPLSIAASPHEATPNPMRTFIKQATLLFKAQSSGLWFLIFSAALIGGLILFKHPGGILPKFSLPEPAFEVVANTNPQEKPVVVVAPVASQIQARPSVFGPSEVRFNPETMRSAVEDTLAEMEGVELLRQPVQGPLSADFVVFTTLLELRDKSASFKGYGITAQTLATECSLRLQIVRCATKTTIFAKVLEGSATDVRTAAAQAAFSDDRNLEAIKDLLKKLTNDAAFKNALRGTKGERDRETFNPKH